ncbi:MAG: carboxypeptidase-like regulatory domain-containing protein [Bacteroidia bacterium]
MKHIFSLALLLIFMGSFAQQKVPWKDGKHELVQFSGVVVEGDSLKPVPYASVIVQDSYRGTISDYFGYFSFVAQEGDTIEFSAIGYRPALFVIPDTLSDDKYSLIQVLRTDTVTLSQMTVYPWPTREQFKKAFLSLELPEDDVVRADRNMARADMKERLYNTQMDASLNYKNSMQQYQSKMYYAGQLPPNNLLNPIAWAKFIKAWQKGDFKKKK